MPQVGALLFLHNAEERNRYAVVTCNPVSGGFIVGGIDWNISINGTDSNGDKVIPLFCTIDNYQNANAISYNLDGIIGGVAAYTKTVISINARSRNLSLTLNTGIVDVYFSEKRLPLSEGQKFQVSAQTLTFILTASGNFVVPQSWNNANNKIHVLGPGASGTVGAAANYGAGGGGGAYARKNNVTLVPATIIPCVVGTTAGGTDTNFNGAGFLMAKAAAGVNGGTAAASVGDFKTSGGNGGAGNNINLAGGGGAAGPNAGGVNQGASIGGSGDGGFTGGLGGNPNLGVPNSNGGNGVTWQRFVDGAFFGPGGGGGGGGVTNPAGGNGGNYGAGGGGSYNGGAIGVGTNGLIVVEWTP